MTFFVSTLIIFASLVSTYGWGWMLARISYSDKDLHWAFLSALGLSCLIFLGGILNALSIAYPVALYVLFSIGIIFTLVALFQHRAINPTHQSDEFSRVSADSVFSLLSYVVILGVAAFLVVTLMPTNVFNRFDDMYKYLINPFRMIQTGTLGGNPFDSLGFDSLGAQSFLQAFILSIFPIGYVNGFDSVFCFILTAFLLVGIAQSIKTHGLYLLVSILIFIIIHPQVGNITATYSGSVMSLGMIFAGSLLADSQSGSEMKSVVARALPFALFISALITLKMTFIFFAVIYSSIYFLILLYFFKDKKHCIVTVAFIMALILIFLLPWITVYGGNYLYVLKHSLHSITLAPSESNWSLFQGDIINRFLSSDNLFLGGHYFSYVFVMIMLLVTSILSVFCIKRNENIAIRPYLISIFASGVAGIASYLLHTYMLLDSETTLRYSLPVFIAILPYAVIILGSHLVLFHPVIRGNKSHTKAIRLGMTAVLIVLTIMLIGLFWDNLRDRIHLAYYNRTNISLLLGREDDSFYINFNKYALSNDARDLVRSIQSKTKKGQVIFASIHMPYHLDFTRNIIYTFPAPWALNPRMWINMSFTYNPEDIRKYFKKMGIRYIMMEYNSKAMLVNEEIMKVYINEPRPFLWREMRYTWYYTKMMYALAEKNKIIYNANGIILIDLE